MGLISLAVSGIMDANKKIKQKQAAEDDSFRNIVVKNMYSIDVPSFLSQETRSKGDASLQCSNKVLDVLFQVIDEPKSDLVDALTEMEADLSPFDDDDTLLDKLAALSLNNLFGEDNAEIGDYKRTKINSLDAITLNAFRKRSFLHDALYGSFAFVEGKNNLYQIMMITGGTSIPKLADKLEKSILSFKEL